MDTKFTPGPWTIHWNTSGGDFHWIVPTNDQSMSIAMVETHAPTDGDMEAMGKINAKLIAAAPDMYEALKKLVERIDFNGGIGEYQGGSAFVMEKARAALAKVQS